MSVAPARWQSTSDVRQAAVQQAQRHAGVRRDARATPWPSTNSSGARCGTLVHQPRRRAGDEVRDDVVDRDPPAGDRDPGLAGGDERGLAARARGPRASSSSVTDILPIAQSEPTVCTTRTSGRSRPAGTLSPGGAARRSRSSTPAAAAAADSSGILGQHRVQPRLDAASRRRSPPAAPRATRRSARRRTARRRSPARSRRAARPRRRVGHDRHRPPRVRHDLGGASRPADAASTTHDDLALAVAQDPVRGLGVGVGELAAGEEREPISHRPAPRPGPGARDSTSRPSASPRPANGCDEISRCPSRSM